MKVIFSRKHCKQDFDHNVGDTFVTLSNTWLTRHWDDELTFTVNHIDEFSQGEHVENFMFNCYDDDHNAATFSWGAAVSSFCTISSAVLLNESLGGALGVVLGFSSAPFVFMVVMLIMATVISRGRNFKSFKAKCNNQTVMQVICDKNTTQEEKELIQEINDLIYHQGVVPWDHVVKPLCIFADEDYKTLPRLDRETIKLDTLKFMKQEIEEQKRVQSIDVMQDVNKKMLALRSLN